jgi:pyruvate dehydrogenase E2 component (dihydrolipoyllysine-residue acetyltransferase)
MAAEVVMPRLSDSMEEGTILQWLKAVGDEVKRGDELVEIETDKANMTYEATDEGVLIEIVAEEGDTLPIGETIARIGASGEEAPSREGAKEKPAEAEAPEPAEAEAPQAEAKPTTKTERPPARTTPVEADGDGRVKASPVARRMARDLNVELARIEGSGPGGRIVKADVEAAAGEAPAAALREQERRPAPAAAPAAAAPSSDGAKGEVQVVELNRMQQTVARRMAESKATVPHFYLETEIDMTEAVEVRAELKELAGDAPAPTFNDMVVKACALALREFPRANGAYRDGRVELYSRVNVGVAVAAQDALVVPTVFDADRKSLGEIAAETRALAEKVRNGKITPPELSGGTFAVSNLGMFGVTNFAAVINPPQAGLLAVGALQPKPVAERGTRRVVVRDMMGVTLACDHRILYGADGARFLARIRELLERPLAMAL